MPVIFALDSSLSMFAPISSKSPTDTIIAACKLGILSAVEFLSATYKRSVLVALGSFSSQFTCLAPFARDPVYFKTALEDIKCGDVIVIRNMLAGINRLVLEAWSSSQQVTVVIVTDGGISLRDDFGYLLLDESGFAFPVKLHVLLVNSKNGTTDGTVWEKLVAHHGGSVFPVNISSVADAVNGFTRFAIENLQLPAVKVELGCLSSFASLYPATQLQNNECLTFAIGGFLPATNEIYNAEADSRHALLFREDVDATPNYDENHTSSFLTALFTSLKLENVVAVCRIREYDDRYAIVHVSSEMKKRPCLNVAILKPGPVPIPWLGPIPSLTLSALAPSNATNTTPKKRKSYNDTSSYIVWGKAEGLKADVNRVLRLSKRLPDKSTAFLKELNKLRSSSLTLGTVDLLNVVSSALNREATACSNPDGKAMLSYCAEQLSSGQPSQEIDIDIAYSPVNKTEKN